MKQVKLIKPYTDKEMEGLELPEGVIMTYEDKKADFLIKKGIAEHIQTIPEPAKKKKK